MNGIDPANDVMASAMRNCRSSARSSATAANAGCLGCSSGFVMLKVMPS
jgi:hypothetical protein